jgi:hypothetical protein
MVRTSLLQGTSESMLAALQHLFRDELNPVAPKAQGKVQVCNTLSRAIPNQQNWNKQRLVWLEKDVCQTTCAHALPRF